MNVTERIKNGRNLLPVLMIAVGYPDVDTVSGASVSNWEEHRVNWDR